MSRPSGYFAFEKRPGDHAWLDLMRAIAIAVVLLRHGQRAIAQPSDGAPDFLQAFLLNGWIGVDLFFVLSGYLISRHLLRHGVGTRHFDFTHYLTLRALRIVPAYFAVMALIAVSAFPFYAIDTRHLGFRMAYHAVFLQDYLPSNINVVFWSLGVEEKFYLIAPVLIWFAMTRASLGRRMLVVLAVFALSPIFRAATYFVHASPMSYETFFPILRSPFYACLEPLMIGVAIAVAQHAGAVGMSPRKGSRVVALALIALTVFLASHELMREIGPFEAIAQPSVIAVLCGLLTLGAVMMGNAPAPCEPVVRMIARLSYSLYLVHYPLLPLCVAVARPGEFPLVSFWISYLAVSVAIACLLHFSVEKPFLVLKDKLARDRVAGDAARDEPKPPWRRQTNVWHRITNPAWGANRLRIGSAKERVRRALSGRASVYSSRDDHGS
jgi:peptidoglycan/LPS O-acetylase OafA/YrhL